MEKKSTGIISVEREPGDPYRDSGTDWKAVEALTNEEVEQAALSDPDSAPVPVYDTPGLIPGTNPKKLREKLGMTQEEFASSYGIPVGTLRDWEQCRKNPDATARAYLRVIARNPQVVAEWLRSAA
jgi:putative transcriptional regulator